MIARTSVTEMFIVVVQKVIIIKKINFDSKNIKNNTTPVCFFVIYYWM
jgi:hypothetical protein